MTMMRMIKKMEIKTQTNAGIRNDDKGIAPPVPVNSGAVGLDSNHRSRRSFDEEMKSSYKSSRKESEPKVRPSRPTSVSQVATWC
jgi:hypothetical protein